MNSVDRIDQRPNNPKRRILPRFISDPALRVAFAVGTALGSAAAIAPTVEASSGNLLSNSAECFPFSAPKGGPVSTDLKMEGHRFYTLYDGANKPVKDITSELQKNPGQQVYDSYDWEFKDVGDISGVDATFYDYKLSLANGSDAQVMRIRYAQNQVDASGYRLEKINGTSENTGNTLHFEKDSPDRVVEFTNQCGQTEFRGGIIVTKARMLRDGVLKAVKNAEVLLVDGCVFFDRMLTEHSLKPKSEPTQLIEEPQAPAQVPGRRSVPAPVQLPKSGDGSTR